MKPIRKVAVLIETSREYGRGLLRGVAKFNQENSGWSIYFKQQDLGAALPKWLKNWNGDGILARVSNKQMARTLLKTGIPFIDLRGGAKDLGIPAFGIDSQSICQLAFEHLSACGLENFAFVGEPAGQHVYDDERQKTFASIVEATGAKCHLFSGKQRESSWHLSQSELTKWLIRLPKPIGIMCCHDDRGQQVLDACQRAELNVPDDVAIIGVDDDEFLCQLASPSLTSINVDAARIGYAAAALLEQMMNGEPRSDQPVWFKAIGVSARQSTDILFCDDPEISLAIRLIRSHACQQLSVDEIEQKVSISRSLLNRRFKKIVGRTPKQEIIRLQMETAKRLLIMPDATVACVSQQCGFNESWYFISVFRKHYGITPGEYRRINRSK